MRHTVEFFTHATPSERTLIEVINDFLRDIPESEVADELRGICYEILSVRQFRNAQKKLPIYMISLTNNPSKKKSIFGENHL